MDINKLAAQLEEQLDSESLPCRKCNGSKLTIREEFTSMDGKVYPRTEKPCIWCDGVGHFTKPDLVELVAAVKGRKPGTLRSKRPDDTRAYFIWRMARFHTGADVTLPMTAQMDIAPDPYRELLDFWAETVAERLSGHKSAGRARWRSAMYGEAPQERYLPESAFPGGPVADANKPDEELLELL
jgi:hypothetical protein